MVTLYHEQVVLSMTGAIVHIILKNIPLRYLMVNGKERVMKRILTGILVVVDLEKIVIHTGMLKEGPIETLMTTVRKMIIADIVGMLTKKRAAIRGPLSLGESQGVVVIMTIQGKTLSMTGPGKIAETVKGIPEIDLMTGAIERRIQKDKLQL